MPSDPVSVLLHSSHTKISGGEIVKFLQNSIETLNSMSHFLYFIIFKIADEPSKISENDRNVIKQHVVELMLRSPEQYQKQLSEAISIIGTVLKQKFALEILLLDKHFL